MIYGTAAGLGYATFLNIATVVNGGGISGSELGAGIIRMVVIDAGAGVRWADCSAISSPAPSSTTSRLWWMPAGLAIAAVINGLFSWVSGEITRVAVDDQRGRLGRRRLQPVAGAGPGGRAGRARLAGRHLLPDAARQPADAFRRRRATTVGGDCMTTTTTRNVDAAAAPASASTGATAGRLC